MKLSELKTLAVSNLPKNESCPQCGSKEFAVARDMSSTRYHCNSSWLPRNKYGGINPRIVLQLIERIEKLSDALENGIWGRPYNVGEITASDAEELAKRIVETYGADVELE